MVGEEPGESCGGSASFQSQPLRLAGTSGDHRISAGAGAGGRAQLSLTVLMETPQPPWATWASARLSPWIR